MPSEYDEYLLNDDDIKDFTSVELTQRAIDIFSDEDDVHRSTLKALFLVRAKELGIDKEIGNLIKSYEKAMAKIEPKPMPTHKVQVLTDSNGKPSLTIGNFYKIMSEDKHYQNIKYNVVRDAPEIVKADGTIERWSDTEIARSKMYIEEEYKMYSKDKHDDALRMLFAERRYNPILDVLSTVKWDGKERCSNFLTKWAKADDSPYVHEVSRLIFAGGIWRLIQPGCKFDDVPILIGKQGTGKSTLCKFLAINDDWFGEVKTVDGDKSIEQIKGKWICEIQELSAFTKKKDVEAVKSFITRQREQYRKPWDKEPSEVLRRCSMIGTSNENCPLVDKSGNRRFYPVFINSDGYEVSDAENEIRDYALQCWAEAKAKYEAGTMPNYADKRLAAEYKAAQDNALQDDWRIGAIKSYLDTLPQGYLVCTREISHKALSIDPEHPKEPTMLDSKEIGQIMSMSIISEDWERCKSSVRTERYGVQKCWKKIGDAAVDELPF